MIDKVITDDLLAALKEWLDFNLDAGCDLDQLRETLIGHGYRRRDVDTFLEAQVSARRQADALFDADALEDGAQAADRFWRRAEVLAGFNRISLGDRAVCLQFKCPALGAVFIPHFLADEECDAMIAAHGRQLSQTPVIDERDGSTLTTIDRSSRGARIARGATDLVRRIESRIARLTAIPTSHGEGLQLLHYAVGGEYRPHVDYFDPATPGGARALAHNSQRLATVILYLSDVEAGGATQFPAFSLAFTPAKGAALLFASVDRDGRPLPNAIHAGAPVASGEKWIATKWIRQTAQTRVAPTTARA